MVRVVMMFSILKIVCVLCCVGLCYSAPIARRGALSSVVERGCIFTAHYVRKNYFDYPDLGRRQVTVAMTTTVAMETTTHLNWVTYLYDTMRKEYVPMELFKALMNCGREYSMYAINASDDLKNQLNVDYGAVPGLG